MAGQRFALVVATDEYDDPGLTKLSAPATDAEHLADVLSAPDLGGFAVEVLRNGTSYEIESAIELLLAERIPDDTVLLHFSCHGIKDEGGELYLAARNTRPSLLASTAVEAALVNRLMRRSRAQRVVLLLDCCYGGAFERGMSARATGDVNVGESFVQDAIAGRGRAVITASSAVEYAFEGTELTDTRDRRPSVFTGALVQGLESGEADRDQDGKVALGELYDYVYEAVKRQTPNQTPGKWEYGLHGEFVLARNPRRQIRPAPLPPEIVAMLDDGIVASRLGAVAELSWLAGQRDLALAMAARGTLERMAREDDSRRVTEAATEALERTKLRVSPDAVDLGVSTVGAQAPQAKITISGSPLASVVTIAAPQGIKVEQAGDVITVTLPTDAPAQIDGVIALNSPAGSAEIPFRAAVRVAEALQPAATPVPVPPPPDQSIPPPAQPVEPAHLPPKPIPPGPQPSPGDPSSEPKAGRGWRTWVVRAAAMVAAVVGALFIIGLLNQPPDGGADGGGSGDGGDGGGGSAGSLDSSLDASFGEMQLVAGFPDDPRSVDVIGGGLVAVAAQTSCSGHARPAPDLEVAYTAGGAELLRFYFVADAGEDDATMIVNGPDAAWSCGDDQYSRNPAVDFPDPSEGVYDVWIGSFVEGDEVPGTLYVTEIDANHP